MGNFDKRFIVVLSVILLLAVSFLSDAVPTAHAVTQSQDASATWSYWISLGPSNPPLQDWDYCPVLSGRKVVLTGLGKYNLTYYANDSDCKMKAFDHDGGHGIGYTLPKTHGGFKTLPAKLQHGKLHSIVVYS